MIAQPSKAVARLIGRALAAVRTPPWSLAMLAWFTGLVVQGGSFGTVDTWRRYQVTRSFWRGEPPVAPSDYAHSGLVGVDGALHAWYGIGQSLVMAPADFVAGGLVALLGVDPTYAARMEVATVAFLTFPAISALNAVLAYGVLREIGGFTVRTAVLGVAAWIFGSTFLHYAQVSQENSLDLLLSLVVGLCAFRWAREGSRRALFIAGLAALLNALVRITTLVDAHVLVLAAVASQTRWGNASEASRLRARAVDLARIWLPLVLVAMLFDRGYHVLRFGWDAIDTTYIHLYGARERALHPELPSNYPFSGSFIEGFFGPIVSPNHSVFLFDPLALPAIFLFAVALYRVRMSRETSAFFAACLVSFLLRLLFYSRYAAWSGGTSWSSRFVLTPVQLWTLFAVPLFVSLRPLLPSPVRLLGPVLLALSVSLQILSVLVEPNLEILQAQCEGRELRLISDRGRNVVRELLGVDAAGLSCSGRIADDYLRPAFLPFGNGRDLPRRVWPVVTGAWLLLVSGLAYSLVNVLRSAARGERASLSPRGTAD